MNVPRRAHALVRRRKPSGGNDRLAQILKHAGERISMLSVREGREHLPWPENGHRKRSAS